jgi:hypothetical protein
MQVLKTLLNIACNKQNMQNNMHDMQNMQMLFPICRICTAYFADAGILYTWTGLGKSVHTGTYQYVLVQPWHGTRQYENLTVVRTGMYWYIPVRKLKKTSCFLTFPERVRRDKIKAAQLLCMGYNVAKLNLKTTPSQV